MKIDPYQSKQLYDRWKTRAVTGIAGVTQENHQVIMRFLGDMERGLNVAAKHKKGGRGYLRLNTLRTKLVFLAKSFDHHLGTSLLGVTEEQLHTFFGEMRNGTIRTRRGVPYRATGDYVKDFKTFWHWHMRVVRKQGREITDLCIDLDASCDKPPWVYLTEDQVQALCRHAKFAYRALLLFLYDSGIRSPTELLNVHVSDLGEHCTTVRIQEESSKTFGRTINLLLCSDVLREYLRERQPLPPTPRKTRPWRCAHTRRRPLQRAHHVRPAPFQRMLLAPSLQERIRTQIPLWLERKHHDPLLHRTPRHERYHHLRRRAPGREHRRRTTHPRNCRKDNARRRTPRATPRGTHHAPTSRSTLQERINLVLAFLDRGQRPVTRCNGQVALRQRMITLFLKLLDTPPQLLKDTTKLPDASLQFSNIHEDEEKSRTYKYSTALPRLGSVRSWHCSVDSSGPLERERVS